jgi:hypothetical protein
MLNNYSSKKARVDKGQGPARHRSNNSFRWDRFWERQTAGFGKNRPPSGKSIFRTSTTPEVATILIGGQRHAGTEWPRRRRGTEKRDETRAVSFDHFVGTLLKGQRHV